MTRLRSHVGVQAGNGLVARLGPVVLLAPGGNDADVFTAALVSALELAVAESPALPARQLAWRLLDAARTQPAADHAFGAVVSTPDGYAVLLFGRARASVDTASGALELCGDDALTAVDHLLTGPSVRVAVTLTDGPVAVDSRFDLRDGLVPGCGFVLTAEEQTAEEQMVAEQTPVAEATELHEVYEVPDIADRTSTEALPPLPDPPQPLRRAVQETSLATPVPSALLSDEGHRTLLDRAYVFGREPHVDESVGRGAASPVQVRDPDNLISRVQAYVWVEHDEVFVRDADSANGTFVAPPGAEGWTRLGHEPVSLPRGWAMRMGRHTFTHVERSD